MSSWPVIHAAIAANLVATNAADWAAILAFLRHGQPIATAAALDKWPVFKDKGFEACFHGMLLGGLLPCKLAKASSRALRRTGHWVGRAMMFMVCNLWSDSACIRAFGSSGEQP
jgi:hypothetical protein